MQFNETDAAKHSGHANVSRRRRLWVQVAQSTWDRFYNLDVAIRQANRAVFKQVIKDTARRSEPVQLRLL